MMSKLQILVFVFYIQKPSVSSNCVTVNYEGHTENGAFQLKTLLIKVMRDYSSECVKSECVTYELMLPLCKMALQ